MNQVEQSVAEYVDEVWEDVVADIEQMDAIIAQFLDYARGEGNENAVKTDLNTLIEQISARRSRSATPPMLTLGDLPVAPRIRQKAFARAIANLLDNARKYGAEPITIATRSQGNEVVIDVIDSGPGVPESEFERLKRPFTRLQDARTDASGTGLGLAIVERVARLHGGKFELLNRNEGGLIARLRLPLQ